MPIFSSFGSCEQNFTSKILQVGKKEKEPRILLTNALLRVVACYELSPVTNCRSTIYNYTNEFKFNETFEEKTMKQNLGKIRDI